MQVILLYGTVVLIWGSTWFAIVFQLGDVAAELSIAYRFGLAAILLYGYALLTKRRLRIPSMTMPFLALQGVLLFCVNYILVYYSTGYITSGLVAVVFSSMVLFNAIFERLFFRTRVDPRLLIAALLGATGIVMIFWREVSVLNFEDDAVVGIALAFAGVISASLGNMAAVVNTRRNLPVVVVNAHAMAFASLVALLYATIIGRPFSFSYEPGYIVSLLFLAVFGSSIAFGCYLALIRRIGAARAGYSSVLFPVVALAISTVFEGYQWTSLAAIGILFTLAGNWLILSQRKKLIRE